MNHKKIQPPLGQIWKFGRNFFGRNFGFGKAAEISAFGFSAKPNFAQCFGPVAPDPHFRSGAGTGLKLGGGTKPKSGISTMMVLGDFV